MNTLAYPFEPSQHNFKHTFVRRAGKPGYSHNSERLALPGLRFNQVSLGCAKLSQCFYLSLKKMI